MSLRTWAVLRDSIVVDMFDAGLDLVDNFVERVVDNTGVVTPPWYDATVEFVDVTDVEPRPMSGFYKASNGRWVDGNPSLVADRYTIPADGTTAATVTFSQKGPQAPVEVTFDVNGQTVTESLTADKATVEVVSTNPGDEIVVSTGGSSVTIQVEA